ncbi:MAG TPA: hypothetical protein VJU86_16675 [Pyrinomonadaceae bacterium]|nr:hypothetical protein [Pyrinomonadaceae bacterium]
MTSMRHVILTAVFLLLTCATALAQRPGPQFRRELACEPFEPRTKLEALESRYERILVKGFSQIAHLSVRGAVIRVDAVELKDSSSPMRALGVVVSMGGISESRDSGPSAPRQNRSYIDYEEIDPLIKGMEAVGRVNESVTKLASFEARYRTLGDLEVVVFRQGRASGTAASVSSGICDKVTGLMTLDELETLKAHIIEAKARLDELK